MNENNEELSKIAEKLSDINTTIVNDLNFNKSTDINTTLRNLNDIQKQIEEVVSKTNG